MHTVGGIHLLIKKVALVGDGINDLETGTVDVEVDETKVTDSQMREAIEEQGYDVKA